MTSAQDRPTDEAIGFRETLRDGRMPFAGAIVNRVHAAHPSGGGRA